MYKVEIEKFEGPLDLLLEIIEAKKLPLHEISLAEIAGQFLDHIERMKERKIEEIIEFLVIASRLTLLKSRELVPQEKSDDPDGNIKNLKQQLVFYQIFRKGSRLLKKSYANERRLYERKAFCGFENTFYFPRKLSSKKMSETVKSLATEIVLPQKIPQAEIKSVISLEECVKNIEKILIEQKRVEFSKIIEEKEPEEKLVHFLGVLEFVRSGKASANQKESFGAIRIVAIT